MDKRALIFFLIFSFGLCYAGQEQKLDIVLEEIEEQKQEIDRIKSQQSDYSQKIDVYNKKLKNAQSRMDFLQGKYSGKSKEKRKLNKQILDLKESIKEIKILYLLSFTRLYEAEYIEEEPISSSVLSSLMRSSDKKVTQYSQKKTKLSQSTVSLNKQIKDLEQKRDKEQKNISFSRYVTSAVSKDMVASKKKEKEVSKKLAFLQEERDKLEKIIADLRLETQVTGYSYKFSAPYILWPAKGKIVENELRRSGLDICTQDNYCKAVDDGVVVDYKKIGNKICLIVDHRNGYISVYIYKGSTLAELRGKVKRGQNLAILQSEIIHFELRKDLKESVDPRLFFQN